jgi:hypothetical protein
MMRRIVFLSVRGTPRVLKGMYLVLSYQNRSRLRKRNELEDLKRENNTLRRDCGLLSTRCDAIEVAMAEYKSLYEIELLKNQ